MTRLSRSFVMFGQTKFTTLYTHPTSPSRTLNLDRAPFLTAPTLSRPNPQSAPRSRTILTVCPHLAARQSLNSRVGNRVWWRAPADAVTVAATCVEAPQRMALRGQRAPTTLTLDLVVFASTMLQFLRARCCSFLGGCRCMLHSRGRQHGTGEQLQHTSRGLR